MFVSVINLNTPNIEYIFSLHTVVIALPIKIYS